MRSRHRLRAAVWELGDRGDRLQRWCRAAGGGPAPCGAEPFRPVAVHGVYADDDTVVVLWDGEGTRLDGKPYENTYAWFMMFRDGLVVEATAFFDSIAFNELWSEVNPAD
jgi:SnoaL-like domain